MLEKLRENPLLKPRHSTTVRFSHLKVVLVLKTICWAWGVMGREGCISRKSCMFRRLGTLVVFHKYAICDLQQDVGYNKIKIEGTLPIENPADSRVDAYLIALYTHAMSTLICLLQKHHSAANIWKRNIEVLAYRTCVLVIGRKERAGQHASLLSVQKRPF